MNEFEERIHRTWVQLLIDHNYKEAAAIAIDSELHVSHEEEHRLTDGGHPEDHEAWFWYEYVVVNISVPQAMHTFIKQTESIKTVLERGLSAILDQQVLRLTSQWGQRSFTIISSDLQFVYKIRLLDVEQNWKNIARRLIAESDLVNQGLITERVFNRNSKNPLEYNEMKFASQSEIRIAQELERRGILFFPLPLAVRHRTGNFYDDHREPDFLICENGVWGILEVAFHPDRYEKDSEKSAWFKEAGILCVEHYTAEKCYNHAGEVVTQFLSILAKHGK